MTICDKCKKNEATEEIVFSYGVGMFTSFVLCNECYEDELQRTHPGRITKGDCYTKVDCRDLGPIAISGMDNEL